MRLPLAGTPMEQATDGPTPSHSSTASEVTSPGSVGRLRVLRVLKGLRRFLSQRIGAPNQDAADSVPGHSATAATDIALDDQRGVEDESEERESNDDGSWREELDALLASVDLPAADASNALVVWKPAQKFVPRKQPARKSMLRRQKLARPWTFWENLFLCSSIAIEAAFFAQLLEAYLGGSRRARIDAWRYVLILCFVAVGLVGPAAQVYAQAHDNQAYVGEGSASTAGDDRSRSAVEKPGATSANFLDFPSVCPSVAAWLLPGQDGATSSEQREQGHLASGGSEAVTTPLVKKAGGSGSLRGAGSAADRGVATSGEKKMEESSEGNEPVHDDGSSDSGTSDDSESAAARTAIGSEGQHSIKGSDGRVRMCGPPQVKRDDDSHCIVS